MIFYCVFLAWPVLQFAVFYIGVNFNSILMSFKSNQGKLFSLDQYKWVFKDFIGAGEFGKYLMVSLKSFALTTIITVPLGLLFAYYIYKKLFGWGAFRVILFLPQIISGVVIALIFRWFIAEYVPALFPAIGDILSVERMEQTAYPVLMFYIMWIGFGTTVLMYSNKMSSIPEEIVESAHLDGATGLKEFWHIVLPLTYSTFSVFFITGVSQIFVNQYGAYELFPHDANHTVKSIGYYFFVNVKSLVAGAVDPTDRPELFRYAALGVVLTFITIPFALTIRWALEKFGPSEE